jgi:thiol:disulfide interchange protein
MARNHCLARCSAVLATVAWVCCGCERSQDLPPVAPAAAWAPGDAPADLIQGDIRFVDDYATAIAQSQSENKPLMLFFTAGWCRFCKQMAQQTFRQDPVVALSRRFVCVLVDADRQSELCRLFQVRMFPTVIFLSHDSVPLGRVLGKQPSHRLVMEMQSALQSVARRHDWSAESVVR